MRADLEVQGRIAMDIVFYSEVDLGFKAAIKQHPDPVTAHAPNEKKTCQHATPCAYQSKIISLTTFKSTLPQRQPMTSVPIYLRTRSPPLPIPIIPHIPSANHFSSFILSCLLIYGSGDCYTVLLVVMVGGRKGGVVG